MPEMICMHYFILDGSLKLTLFNLEGSCQRSLRLSFIFCLPQATRMVLEIESAEIVPNVCMLKSAGGVQLVPALENERFCGSL